MAGKTEIAADRAFARAVSKINAGYNGNSIYSFEYTRALADATGNYERALARAWR